MNRPGAAMRAQLRVSARLYAGVGVLGFVLALSMWQSDRSVAGLGFAVAGWFAWHAHLDAVAAAQIKEQ